MSGSRGWRWSTATVPAVLARDGPPATVASRLAAILRSDLLGRRWPSRELAELLYGSGASEAQSKVGSAMSTLRAHGWVIESKPNHGYRVVVEGRLPGEEVS